MGNLVLSRFAGESIIITTPSGETITIRVSDIKTKHADSTCLPKCRIAIDAPRAYRVMRQELVE